MYVAFDLLALEGEDLTNLPWAERDSRLRDVIADRARAVSVIDNLAVSATSHAGLVALGFEGSVIKRADAPYRPGRSRAWLKHKARHEISARIHAISVSQTRGRMALCDIGAGEGRCWATAGDARQGDRVTLAYSRQDAGGQPREARVVARRAPR